ncbi:Gfo/Idh/MocA family protein [uncultured Cellulomonas sp.]|uniref:Gfo/Idh/MocA family protein n=1 Tax=uncultured Cellulomonas sp. TaxID=189682 RepID=UPI0026130BAE|nr:Gfo/Idh/MocA family oxidoreductase [uncultured Cellulomonas sp.]
MPTPPQTAPPGGASGITRRARFAVVGSGYRAQFFNRLAHVLPDRFTVTGVVSRRAEPGGDVERTWDVPAYRTVAEALAADRPDFVLVSVPWDVAPGVIRELVAADVPVLVETPPAPDVAGLRSLWADVGASGLVQVAEHSPRMPAHAARITLARRGVLGVPTSVQVSSTHEYHAVSLIRAMLGAGFDPVTVHARTFSAPLVSPLSRAGWTDDDEPHAATTTLATLDLGGGRSALYDFTDNQSRNRLRVNRLVLRGSHGEMVDDRLMRMTGPRTIVESHLVRRQTGVEQDLPGFDLEHLSLDGEVLYRNPFEGARLGDDDIAGASLLAGTAAWVAGDAPPPYPLAEGCQDHLVGRAIVESARTGEVVRTGVEPWAGPVR